MKGNERLQAYAWYVAITCVGLAFGALVAWVVLYSSHDIVAVPVDIVVLIIVVGIVVEIPILMSWLRYASQQDRAGETERIVTALSLALQSQTWEIEAHLDNGLKGKIVAGVRSDALDAANLQRRDTAAIAARLAADDAQDRAGTAGLVRDDAAIVAAEQKKDTAAIAERLAQDDAERRENTDG